MNISSKTTTHLKHLSTLKKSHPTPQNSILYRFFSSKITLDKFITNPTTLKSSSTPLPTDVTLRALPYKISSPQHGEPPVLLNGSQEMSPEEILKADLAAFRPDFACVQLDPMPFSRAFTGVTKVTAKQAQRDQLKDDPEMAQKNATQIDMISDGILHPAHGEGSCINMGIAEVAFGMAFPGEGDKYKLGGMFSQEFNEVIQKVQYGTASEEEIGLFREKVNSVKPLLDFAIEEYCPSLSKSRFSPNPTPYHGMEQIYAESFYNLLDICLLEYPEPLSRLYLHSLIQLDYFKAKEIYEAALQCGGELAERSLKLGFGGKVDRQMQRRVINDIFPEICVQPRDEYIASQIYQISAKGYRTMVYLGEANFEGVKKLLEDPPQSIKIPNTLANADMALFEDPVFEKDEYGNLEEDPVKIKDRLREIPEDWKDQIEAHAMLEVAFGTMAWGETYLKNQFPYLKAYREHIDDDDYAKFQQHFKEKYIEHKRPFNRIFK